MHVWFLVTSLARDDSRYDRAFDPFGGCQFGLTKREGESHV